MIQLQCWSKPQIQVLEKPEQGWVFEVVLVIYLMIAFEDDVIDVSHVYIL